MRTGFYIALCGAFITGAAFAAVSGRMELSISLALGALATLCIVYRTAVLPVKAIRTGMDLLKSQDFASRLRKVGNREADEIVDVFNRLMDTTKEERLHNREQNEFLSRLIEASPMGIAICDFEGNIRSSNPAFQSFCNLIPASTLATLQSGEQKVIRPTGSQVLRCSRHHFMDRGFKRAFYLVERLTDEIIQAETGMFHKIVRVMGHEVNNTLGGIASVLESLSDIHADDDLLHSAIEGSRASCVALGKFVKAYSDIVKTPEPVFENLCLADFVSSEKPFLSSMCPPHIEFRTEISESGVCIQADPVLLERVMVNAVKNRRRTGSVVRLSRKSLYPLLFNQKQRPRTRADADSRHIAQTPRRIQPGKPERQNHFLHKIPVLPQSNVINRRITRLIYKTPPLHL